MFGQSCRNTGYERVRGRWGKLASLFGSSGTGTDRLQLGLRAVGIRLDLEMVVAVPADVFLGEEKVSQKLEFRKKKDGTARRTYRGLQIARRLRKCRNIWCLGI